MSWAAAELPSAQPGRIEIVIPGLARATVRAGAEPAFACAPGAEIEWLRRGPVRHAEWLLAERFALRAATVAVGGRAVALTGPPAVGKSLTAATLAGRGATVLADDAVPVADGLAYPVEHELGLWPAAGALLNLRDGTPVRGGLAKARFAFPAAPEPLPLAAIIVLQRGSAIDAPAIEPIAGAARLAVIKAHTALFPLIDGLGLGRAHFRWMAGLGLQVPIHVVRVDCHRHGPDVVADAVERVLDA